MYSPESIQKLVDRIGFADAITTDFPITISSEVKLSESERNVNSFHQLAIVENLYSAVNEINMAELDFNAYLQRIKIESVKEVLTSIIDRDINSINTFDYSQTIIDRPEIFDDAIGYTIAIKCLELFISSNRKNLTERNAKLSIQNLKLELEGVRNDGGFVVSTGIKREKIYAIRQAKKILFPIKIIVDGTSMW